MKLIGVVENVLADGTLAWQAVMDDDTRFDLDLDGIAVGNTLLQWDELHAVLTEDEPRMQA